MKYCHTYNIKINIFVSFADNSYAIYEIER